MGVDHPDSARMNHGLQKVPFVKTSKRKYDHHLNVSELTSEKGQMSYVRPNEVRSDTPNLGKMANG